MTGPDTEARRQERRRAWLIGLALLCCYAFFFYRGGNWNVEARNAQIVALAENHTVAIDSYHEWTGDKAFYRGHYYSDKLLGPSLVAVPFYWISRQLLAPLLGDFTLAMMLSLRVANLAANALPTALLGAFLYLFLGRLGLAPARRVWVVFAYGVGTLAFPYSTALFGHQLGGVCAAAAFMLLWHPQHEWRLPRALAAAALIGLGAICDFTAIFVSCCLVFYALWVASGRPRGTPVGAARLLARLAPFAVVAALPVAVQLGVNWACFGSPFVLPQVHSVQEEFRARHTAGLFGLHLPQLYPLYQVTFGPARGLFYGSPVLLLALPGVALLWKRHRAEAIFIAAVWLAVTLMHSGYDLWSGGSSYGPRFQIAVLGLLAIPLAAAAQRWPLMFKALAAVSIFFMLAVTAHSPFMPEGLRDPLAIALAGFSSGLLIHGNLGLAIGLPGLFSLLPLVAAQFAFLYALSGLRDRETQPPATTPD